MEHAYFRFYGSLNDFLPSQKQQVGFVHWFKERGSVKDAIEALGIPHPEVDLILANGDSVDFSYLVQNGDRISVYPRFQTIDITSLTQARPIPLSSSHFILDVHLGKLATYLRLLGFDVLYQNDYDDAQLAQLAHQDDRILLTQDRALLKRSLVIYGYLVRSHDPQTQVLEVLRRFDLAEAIAPFQRCLRCNGDIKSVEKAEICDRLPPLTRQHYNDFSQCQTCEQIYWRGAHYQRIQDWIDRVVQLADPLKPDQKPDQKPEPSILRI